MSKTSDFFVCRLLLLICTGLTAECSNHTASSSMYYLVDDSTLMYYDMSTEYITATASRAASTLLSTAVITNTPATSPSPTSNIEPPNMQEMENNAVLISLNNITLQQWMQVESVILGIIADECTRQCAMSEVDCGTRNNVNYTSDNIVILPGYPRIVDDKLLVAFSVSLPVGATLSDEEDTVIDQNTLYNIAAAASSNITTQTGIEVHEVGRYSAASATGDSPESETNLALILSLTLIFAALGISVAAAFGSFYVWKMVKKHKSLDLVNKSVKTEQVELMSYKPTAYN